MPSWPELIVAVITVPSIAYAVKLARDNRRYRLELHLYCVCLAGLNNVIFRYKPRSNGLYVGFSKLDQGSKKRYGYTIRGCSWGRVSVVIDFSIKSGGLLITVDDKYFDSFRFSRSLTPQLVENRILAAIRRDAERILEELAQPARR